MLCREQTSGGVFQTVPEPREPRFGRGERGAWLRVRCPPGAGSGTQGVEVLPDFGWELGEIQGPALSRELEAQLWPVLT